MALTTLEEIGLCMAEDFPRRKAEAGSAELLIFDILDTRARIRILEREVNKSSDPARVSELKRDIEKLRFVINGLQSELANRIHTADAVDLRLYSSVHSALGLYGRGVLESVFWSFESETGLDPIDVVNHPRLFGDCIERIFGEMCAERIIAAIKFEISKEFRLQLSKRATLMDAFLLARSKGRRPVNETRRRTERDIQSQKTR